jgi:hypothetical protein
VMCVGVGIGSSDVVPIALFRCLQLEHPCWSSHPILYYRVSETQAATNI